MPQTTRTFIALAVPQNVGDKLARLQTLLAPEATGVRWAEALPFHLTLAFLGDVNNGDLIEVCRAVATASSGIDVFDLRIEGVGFFPDAARPRTIWAGLVGPGLEPLRLLQAKIAAAVDSVNYPADEKKRFVPHITLGSLKPGRGPAADFTPLLNHFRTWSAGSFRVNEAVSFGSNLTPEGPEYTALGRALLKGGKPKSIA